MEKWSTYAMGASNWTSWSPSSFVFACAVPIRFWALLFNNLIRPPASLLQIHRQTFLFPFLLPALSACFLPKKKEKCFMLSEGWKKNIQRYFSVCSVFFWNFKTIECCYSIKFLTGLKFDCRVPIFANAIANVLANIIWSFFHHVMQRPWFSTTFDNVGTQPTIRTM